MIVRCAGILALLAVPSSVVACSLLADTGGLATDTSEIASKPAHDDGGTDTGAPTTDDSGSDASTCTPSMTVDTAFTADLGDWRTNSAVAGDPSVGVIDDGSKAAILLAADCPANAKAGLWRPTLVPLHAFDVEFDVFVRCSDANGCADGLLVQWMSGDSANVVANAFPVPPGEMGTGLLFDVYQNGIGQTTDPDPEVPALSLMGIDPRIADWKHIANKTTNFLAAWHHVAISLREGRATVLYDGTKVLEGATQPLPQGVFGFAAYTGAETIGAAIRNVKGAFYDCVP